LSINAADLSVIDRQRRRLMVKIAMDETPEGRVFGSDVNGGPERFDTYRVKLPTSRGLIALARLDSLRWAARTVTDIRYIKSLG
jgi:hypothetical protein